jgi:hypothetical protein
MSEERIRSLDECGGEEWVPVCPRCLEPCDPLQYYCESCGCNEAINPLVPYMPFTNIRFNAGMVARVWVRFAKGEGRWVRRLFDLLVAVSYFSLLILGVPFMIATKWRKGKYRSAKGMAVCMLIAIVFIALRIAALYMI